MRRQSNARVRVFSGVQPSGTLHIGNWLGAIRNWVQDQDEVEGHFCVVDLHALTEPRDPAELRQKSLDVAATYLACGLDPDRSCVFIQSHVPAHTEGAWLLDCFLPMGWLERMTQFKTRSRANRERASVGLFNYPALMAADILLYDASLVPDAAVEEFLGQPYGRLKSAVTAELVDALEPIQRRYREVRADDIELLRLLGRGAESAAQVAQATLTRVRDSVGLLPRLQRP